MAQNISEWTYQEFQAFLLLYAAHSDLKISEEEKSLISSRVDKEKDKDVYKEFGRQNDFERLQTIMSFREKYFNTEADQDKLLNDLQELFMADNKFQATEQAAFWGLKKIIRS